MARNVQPIAHPVIPRRSATQAPGRPVAPATLLDASAASQQATQANTAILNEQVVPAHHAYTHLPNAPQDPLPVGAPPPTSIGLDFKDGTADSFARQDHVHGFVAPSTAIGNANLVDTSIGLLFFDTGTTHIYAQEVAAVYKPITYDVMTDAPQPPGVSALASAAGLPAYPRHLSHFDHVHAFLAPNAASAPAGVNGAIYLDTSVGPPYTLKAYNGSAWVPMSGGGAAVGTAVTGSHAHSVLVTDGTTPPSLLAEVLAGTNGYVLTMVSGAPAWAASPAVSLAIGDAVTSAVAGSILWVDTGAVLAQDNTDLYWDKTNLRLRVSGLQVSSPATAGYVLTADATGVGTWQTPVAIANTWLVTSPTSGGSQLFAATPRTPLIWGGVNLQLALTAGTYLLMAVVVVQVGTPGSPATLDVQLQLEDLTNLKAIGLESETRRSSAADFDTFTVTLASPYAAPTACNIVIMEEMLNSNDPVYCTGATIMAVRLSDVI